MSEDLAGVTGRVDALGAEGLCLDDALGRVMRFRKENARYEGAFTDGATFEAGCCYGAMSTWELAAACPGLLGKAVTGVDFSGRAIAVMLRCAVWVSDSGQEVEAALAIVGSCGAFLGRSIALAGRSNPEEGAFTACDLMGNQLIPGGSFCARLDETFQECRWLLAGAARQVAWNAALGAGVAHGTWHASDPARWPGPCGGDNDRQEHFLLEASAAHRARSCDY